MWSVREGLEGMPAAQAEKKEEKPKEPEKKVDPQPYPQNHLPCAEYEANFKRDKKDIDYLYCRGLNSETCGDMDTKDLVQPCPPGYEKTSSLSTLSSN